jgi:riboflavin synthase
MFTGIIGAVGSVKSLARKGSAARLEIQVPWSDLALGESISVDGVCLTVAGIRGDALAAEVSHETIHRTIISDYRVGRKVNLERALGLGERLGGHLVYGHVDGVGRIDRLVKRSNCWEIEIVIEAGLRKYMADKASVAVNGISLTVAKVLPSGFGLVIIPHTLLNTSCGQWRAGDRVNIEVDMVAKYLESLSKSK